MSQKNVETDIKNKNYKLFHLSTLWQNIYFPESHFVPLDDSPFHYPK